jgi:hypothetical protein
VGDEVGEEARAALGAELHRAGREPAHARLDVLDQRLGDVLAADGDLAEHGTRLERAGVDGDDLAAIVAEGLPDEKAAGVAALGELGMGVILSSGRCGRSLRP